MSAHARRPSWRERNAALIMSILLFVTVASLLQGRAC